MGGVGDEEEKISALRARVWAPVSGVVFGDDGVRVRVGVGALRSMTM